MKVDEKEKHVFYLVKVKVDTQIKYILTFDIDKLTKNEDYFTTSVVFFLFTVIQLVFFLLISNIIITVSIEMYSIFFK